MQKKIKEFCEQKDLLDDFRNCIEDLNKFKNSNRLHKFTMKLADYSIMCTVFYEGETIQKIFADHRIILEYLKDTYPRLFRHVLFIFDRSDIHKRSGKRLKLKPVDAQVSNMEFEIQEVIYSKMEILGVTKEQVAKALDMDLASFCWMFTDGTIDLQSMVKIAQLLSLDLEILFRETIDI